MIRKLAVVLGALIILGGVIGCVYPFVGEYINSKTHTKIIENYDEEVKGLTEEEMQKMLREAERYNEWIYSRGEVTILTEEEMGRYMSVLDEANTGIMGYIEIPKIDVRLPIYHGTDENVLQVGVGHMAGSSFPVGGNNVHTVLTGHSGLPSSTLFTNLDKIGAGDVFTITVLNRTVTYKVDGTEVVLPEDAVMTVEQGKDLCTLVTCTPIGANTHRLLVHGHRIPNIETNAQTDEETSDTKETEEISWVKAQMLRLEQLSPERFLVFAGCIVFGMLVLVAALIMIFLGKSRKKKIKQERRR